MDKISLIDGVILTKLKTIESSEGNVLRYLRHNDNGFNQFKVVIYFFLTGCVSLLYPAFPTAGFDNPLAGSYYQSFGSFHSHLHSVLRFLLCLKN